ncbi:MAG: zinc ribbon domain-containing protein [Candidatus Heimdallarchaeaceae archaeon]
MITLKARQHIVMSSFFFVGSLILSTFIDAFVSLKLLLIHLLPIFLSNGSIVWLGVGLYLFYKNEKDKKLKIISVLFMIQGVIGFFMLLLGYFDFLYTFLNSIILLILQIFGATSILLLFASFHLLREILNKLIKERRNIITMGFSLEIGFIIYFIYSIINIIVPPTVYINVNVSEPIPILVISPPAIYILAGTLIDEYKPIYFLLSFLEIAYLVTVVFGVWKVRKAFILLDRIPEKLFEQLEIQKLSKKLDTSMQQIEEKLPQIEKIVSEEQQEKLQSIDKTTQPKRMFCIKCGLEIEPDAQFCEECGAKNPYLKDKEELK